MNSPLPDRRTLSGSAFGRRWRASAVVAALACASCAQDKLVCTNAGAIVVDVPHACTVGSEELPICVLEDPSNPVGNPEEIVCCVRTDDPTHLRMVNAPCREIDDGHTWRTCVDADTASLPTLDPPACASDAGIDAAAD